MTSSRYRRLRHILLALPLVALLGFLALVFLSYQKLGDALEASTPGSADALRVPASTEASSPQPVPSSWSAEKENPLDSVDSWCNALHIRVQAAAMEMALKARMRPIEAALAQAKRNSPPRYDRFAGELEFPDGIAAPPYHAYSDEQLQLMLENGDSFAAGLLGLRWMSAERLLKHEDSDRRLVDLQQARAWLEQALRAGEKDLLLAYGDLLHLQMRFGNATMDRMEISSQIQALTELVRTQGTVTERENLALFFEQWLSGPSKHATPEQVSKWRRHYQQMFSAALTPRQSPEVEGALAQQHEMLSAHKKMVERVRRQCPRSAGTPDNR